MSLTYRKIAIVGSREFKNYEQLEREADLFVGLDDWIVSGGALGADSMARRYAKENGLTILEIFPRWRNNANGKSVYDAGAGFKRNKKIVEEADVVLAFYRKGHFQEGGTANTATWARVLEKDLHEYEEE